MKISWKYNYFIGQQFLRLAVALKTTSDELPSDSREQDVCRISVARSVVSFRERNVVFNLIIYFEIVDGNEIFLIPFIDNSWGKSKLTFSFLVCTVKF